MGKTFHCIDKTMAKFKEFLTIFLCRHVLSRDLKGVDKMVTREQMIKDVAWRVGYTKADVKNIMEGIYDYLLDQLARRNDIRVFKGITFESVMMKEHEIRNVRSGEMIRVPPLISIRLKIARSVRDFVNDKYHRLYEDKFEEENKEN